MEIFEWAQLLKNHVQAIQNLDLLQSSTVNINLSILLAYCLIFVSTMKASRAYCLIAFLFCLLIAYTPLYDKLSQVQYYSLFAIIYILLTKRVKPVKAKVACCLLGSFQIFMAWDSHYNGTVETYIWLHYESTVCVLHAFIIGSFIERDAVCISRFMAKLATNLRDIVRNRSNALCLCYYYWYGQFKR